MPDQDDDARQPAQPAADLAESVTTLDVEPPEDLPTATEVGKPMQEPEEVTGDPEWSPDA